jgi:hypothetical protein
VKQTLTLVDLEEAHLGQHSGGSRKRIRRTLQNRAHESSRQGGESGPKFLKRSQDPNAFCHYRSGAKSWTRLKNR